MELFELILILLACVMASAIIDQFIPHFSLPLLQIAVGLVIALIMPALAQVHIDSELFLMLFIAPLLYRDSREVSRKMLWDNRWSILSMAIALVVACVLAAGFILHQVVPAISLAAAFACAAALGPTDAAAVAAMSSTVNLTKRQSILLSGEALINDASGVVSFQFAIAAALTGAFSAGKAVGTFTILFFGGIILGALCGLLLKYGGKMLRRKGYMSVTTHVIFEVFTPFVIFLLAETIEVSGILAVVAAGLVMQEPKVNIKSPELARQEMVTDSFWEVIIFLINGILFVMLGMQLPKVMEADHVEGLSPIIVILAVLAVTFAIMSIRFLWVSGLELIHRDPETGERGTAHFGRTILQALVTTIAGPKGAVTLSIIMTLPLAMRDGTPFAQRDVIIFITSGVILCTLLLANFVLPLLAPIEHDADAEEDMCHARVRVLEKTVREMRRVLQEHEEEDFAPALRVTLMRYRVRLMRERLSMESCGAMLSQMIQEVLDVQQARSDELEKTADHISETERLAYDSILPMIRESIGYFGGAERVGSRPGLKRDKTYRNLTRLYKKTDAFDDDEKARLYYGAVVFAMDLEHEAVHYLQEICGEGDRERAQVAEVLLEEHEAALQSLWGRINYGQDTKFEEIDAFIHSSHDQLPVGMKNNSMDEVRKATHYHDEADANALQIELEMIRECRLEGTITGDQAKAMREEVYLMQTALLE
ncbi:MAG: Na+/H+ antiporter [Firmicutes bacterium]|nr:Na+/H+ antiporter [Bacillota bacterium]